MLKDIVLDSRQDLPELENKSIVVSQRPDYRKTNSQACRSEKDVMDMFCEEDFPNQQILEEGRRSVNFDYGYREFSEGFFKEMRNFTPQPPHFDNHCDRASVGFMPFGPSPCLYNSVSNCTPGNVEYRNDFAACYNVGIKEI